MSAYDIKSLTGLQLRAARALLRWSVAELAGWSRLSEATISRAEKNDGPIIGLTTANLVGLQRTLEDKGIIFIDADDEAGIGVRLAKESR